MKNYKAFGLLVVLLVIFTAIPIYAQLGTTDISSFTIQNIDTSVASVSVTFYAEDGTAVTPNELNGGKTNPFTLDPGESFEVYTPGIPDSELSSGRYSVVVSADRKIAAIANLVGQGSVNFNGSYSGFSEGAGTFYLPAVVYNYYGWYSLISVQNTGSVATDINVSISCSDGATGTLSATNVAPGASAHFDMETTTPTGFTTSTQCNGSADVSASAGGSVVVVDNQTVPSSGNTQSYSGVSAGASKLYIPALYTSYYGWNASVNIRKLGSGNVTVNAVYSDGGSSSCALTDASPSCLLYMPNEHSNSGYYGAEVTATGGDIVAVVNAANGSQAQTYNAVLDGSGSSTVGIPSTMKSYYGWNTSFTCQNIGSTDTTVSVAYDGYTANSYNSASLSAGDTIEVVQAGEAFLPAGFQGGVTVTANTAGASIACIVNLNNATQMGTVAGDWSMSYNAFNQ